MVGAGQLEDAAHGPPSAARPRPTPGRRGGGRTTKRAQMSSVATSSEPTTPHPATASARTTRIRQALERRSVVCMRPSAPGLPPDGERRRTVAATMGSVLCAKLVVNSWPTRGRPSGRAVARPMRDSVRLVGPLGPAVECGSGVVDAAVAYRVSRRDPTFPYCWVLAPCTCCGPALRPASRLLERSDCR